MFVCKAITERVITCHENAFQTTCPLLEGSSTCVVTWRYGPGMTSLHRLGRTGRVLLLAALSSVALALAPAVGAANGTVAAATPSSAPNLAHTSPSVVTALPTGWERVGGEDRFGTAVAMSQRLFPKPPASLRVVIASGESYADAMVAGSLWSTTPQVMLLVRKNSIPSSVAAELKRLRPAKAVIIGGPAAVSDDVAQLVKAYTTGKQVTRYGGKDRYDTSVKAASLALGQGGRLPDFVIIASGENYPDALTAAQLNFWIPGQPLLLTRTDALPAPVYAYLRRQPSFTNSGVSIVGGPAAVSNHVVEQIKELRSEGQIRRLAGANRYATAAKVVDFVGIAGVQRFYLATGDDYPDALVASAAMMAVTTSTSGRPIPARLLLTQSRCHPLGTATTLTMVPSALKIVVGQSAVAYAGTTICGRHS